MYTISGVVEIGNAQDLIQSIAKPISQADDDDMFTMSSEELDE